MLREKGLHSKAFLISQESPAQRQPLLENRSSSSQVDRYFSNWQNALNTTTFAEAA
jgi:hypothetical protein